MSIASNLQIYSQDTNNIKKGDKMQNIVILTGRLGTDIDLQTVNESDLAKFRMVTWHKWRTEDGNWHERNQWHNISKWGKGAKYLPERLKKGDLITVVGEIEYSEYENKDGKTVYFTTIKATTVQKIPCKKEEVKPEPEHYQSKEEGEIEAGIGDKDGGHLPDSDQPF